MPNQPPSDRTRAKGGPPVFKRSLSRFIGSLSAGDPPRTKKHETNPIFARQICETTLNLRTTNHQLRTIYTKRTQSTTQYTIHNIQYTIPRPNPRTTNHQLQTRNAKQTQFAAPRHHLATLPEGQSRFIGEPNSPPRPHYSQFTIAAQRRSRFIGIHYFTKRTQ